VSPRLFFALWPPRETALALHAWAKGLEGRATPAQKIHLTLAFLGGADAHRAIAAARRVRAGAFELPIDTAKYWRGSNIVWVGPREMPHGLHLFVQRLQLELYRDGFTLEPRPFAAHVTLVRKSRPPKAMPELPSLGWPVTQFTLVNSVLGPEGPSYEVLARYALE
jgi:2'-5' RNA ligase